MNKNKKTKPEVRFIERKFRNKVHYYIEVNGEKMGVSASTYARDIAKYRKTKLI